MMKLALLTLPSFVLIDHGHFQYNAAMLGLVAWTIIFIRLQRPLLAACSFSLALLFKQTALYFALPVFSVLLSLCISRKRYRINANLLVLSCFVSWEHLSFLFSQSHYIRSVMTCSKSFIVYSLLHVACLKTRSQTSGA
jgi:uncharacterized membrane protein